MTTPTRSGIPTTFRGTNFRSRLEARWAAFFDLVGWSWIYEPMDLGGWIPDFLVDIDGAHPFLVEVGPCITGDDLIAKAEKAIAHRGDRSVVVLGVSPHRYYLLGATRTEHDTIRGLLGRLDVEPIEALWRRAGNDVQWRGPQSVRSILQTSGWRP